jgi:hypothetical protein
MAGGSSDYQKISGAIFPLPTNHHNRCMNRPANLNALSGNNFVKLIWDKSHTCQTYPI